MGAENRTALDYEQLQEKVDQIRRHLEKIATDTEEYSKFLSECTEHVKSGDSLLNGICDRFETVKVNMTNVLEAQDGLEREINNYVETLIEQRDMETRQLEGLED